MESRASSASSKSLSGTFPEPVPARRDSRGPSAPRICQVSLKSRQPWSSSKHTPVRYFRAPAWQRKDASKDEAAVPPSPHSSVLPAQPVFLLLPHSLIECLSKNGSPLPYLLHLHHRLMEPGWGKPAQWKPISVQSDSGFYQTPGRVRMSCRQRTSEKVQISLDGGRSPSFCGGLRTHFLVGVATLLRLLSEHVISR